MAENLNSNDPYKKMNTGGKDIRPGFLKEADEKKEAAEKLSSAENKASEANKGQKSDGALSKVKKAEAVAGLYNAAAGGGKAALAQDGKKAGGLLGSKKGGAAIAIGLLMIPLLGVAIFAAPSLLIGAIDYNLQDALGFTNTTAILEEQSEHVTAEMMAEGEFPSGFADDLAANGILVGQVTAAGKFVRTNNYIANIDELGEVASIGDYYTKTGDGELAVLFNDKVVTASDFVAVVESDPKMYAAFAEAVDISARYYYSNEVNAIYKEMGFTRDNFSSWEATGDNEKDEESFYKILNKMLDDNPNTELAGKGEWVVYAPCPKPEIPNIPENPEGGGESGGGESGGGESGGGESGGGESAVSGDIKLARFDGNATTFKLADEESGGNTDGLCPYPDGTSFVGGGQSRAKAMIKDTSDRTTDDTTKHATEKAAQLLNTAVSSSEPYLAASVFMAIEEPINRARAGDNGPVNEVMNALTKRTETTYRDVNTGKEVTVNQSILETKNFVAAVSDGSYSKEEANNYSRDRVVSVTKQASDNATKSTVVLGNGRDESWILAILFGRSPSNEDDLMVAEDTMKIAVDEKNSDVFSSIVGGNRALEGGSFISREINRQQIGEMSSDSGAIKAYSQEVKEVLARRAAADRATKSPFDISSPNTFMGSLVRKMGSMMIKNSFASRVTTTLPLVNTVADLTSSAVAGLFGTANAESDEEYTTISGDKCTTINSAANVEGDLYCTAHGTVYTEYMNYTKEDWKKAGVIDEDGKISKGMKEFTILGMDRETAVGTKDAEVCKRARGDGILSSILSLFDICAGVSEGVATGAVYTLSSSNGYLNSVQKYSGYALYDTVSSLLKEKQSSVSMFRDEYYAENPKDNSTAGRIARISGMTKAEAQIALDYADELRVIANYDASERYAFGETLGLNEDDGMMFDDEEVMMAIYALMLDKMSFADVRNRTNLV